MEDSQNNRQRILRRHRRERRELQDQICAMKNTVPKTDRKRRKQMLQDVARLEAELEQRHQQELEKFLPPEDPDVESVTKNLAKINLENQPPRVCRAEKRRERKAALRKERQERVDESETEHLSNYRRQEEEKVAAILGAKNLAMKDIPADGHCMFRAIQDQLPFPVTIDSLRRRTADYMQKHVDDFLPFFTDAEPGDGYTHDDFKTYCDNIVRGSWGGQLELTALSHILQTPIEVVQAESPIIMIGEEYNKKPLTLVYLHHACNFGEHYNSVKLLEAGAVGGIAPRLY
ncbi:OTU domain-containing protein 6A [Dipodomys merriami]|uniref:OTU domain-containing protein 6A n=1 Tax=Dipodomys merriami TaxID=94247 RepID=UPI003855D605